MSVLKPSEIEIEQILSKNSEMALLYIQSLEIQMLYNQEIPKNKFNPIKYYLVPKKWIDEYKNLFNYNTIKQKYINIDFSDYNSLKSKILQSSSFLSKNSDSSMNSKIPQIENNFTQIPRYQIEYPNDFFPVKEEILQQYFNGKKEYLYELIIGENKIFVIDNKSKKNIFVCSLNYDNEDSEEIDDFTINVDYILTYNKENIFKQELKNFISENRGFNKYCKERHLNINIKTDQEINSEKGKIGIFLQTSNASFNTPNVFIKEYVENVENQNPNNIYQQNQNSFDQNNINKSTVRTKVNVNLSLSKNHEKRMSDLNNNNSRNSFNNPNNPFINNISNQSNELKVNRFNPIFGIVNENQKNFQQMNQKYYNNIPSNFQNDNNLNNFQNDNNPNNFQNDNNPNNFQNDNNPNNFQNINQNNFQNNYPNQNRANIIICIDGEIYSQIKKTNITISYMPNNDDNQNLRFNKRINIPNNNYRINSYNNNNPNNFIRNISIENSNNFNNLNNMMQGQNPNIYYKNQFCS